MIQFASSPTLLVAALLVTSLSPMFGGEDNGSTRALRGTIYFSNNTPPNLDEFPVEVFTRDQKTRVAETTPTDAGDFYLAGLKPGKYV